MGTAQVHKMYTSGTPTSSTKRTAIKQLNQSIKRKQIRDIYSLKQSLEKHGSSRSETDFSNPSKVLAFLSCQILHTRQWGITLQITTLLPLPNLPCQLAKSSTTPFSITQWTPKRENSILQSSWAIEQWRSRWSIVSPALLHMQHQSIMISHRFLRLSTVRIFPRVAVQKKKET